MFSAVAACPASPYLPVVKPTVWNMIMWLFSKVFNSENVGHRPLGVLWNRWSISICLRFSVLQPIKAASCGFWGALCWVQCRLTFKLTGSGLYVRIADGVKVGGTTDKNCPGCIFSLSLVFLSFSLLYVADDETQHGVDGLFKHSHMTATRVMQFCDIFSIPPLIWTDLAEDTCNRTQVASFSSFWPNCVFVNAVKSVPHICRLCQDL